MTLEQILPEIRKGRRFRNKRGKEKGVWYVALNNQNAHSLMDDDWELEPEIQNHFIRPGLYARPIDIGFMVCCEDDEVPNDGFFRISHQELDDLHAASLKARGIEDKPKGIQQFTGVNPWYREYNEPDFQALDALFNNRDASYSERLIAIHMAGWEAYQKALEEER